MRSRRCVMASGRLQTSDSTAARWSAVRSGLASGGAVRVSSMRIERLQGGFNWCIAADGTDPERGPEHQVYRFIETWCSSDHSDFEQQGRGGQNHHHDHACRNAAGAGVCGPPGGCGPAGVRRCVAPPPGGGRTQKRTSGVRTDHADHPGPRPGQYECGLCGH